MSSFAVLTHRVIYCTVKPGCCGEPGTARNRAWLVGTQGRNHPVWTGRLQRWGTWHRRELLHLGQRAEQQQLCGCKAHNPSEQLCANTFIWFSCLNSSLIFFFQRNHKLGSATLCPNKPSPSKQSCPSCWWPSISGSTGFTGAE